MEISLSKLAYFNCTEADKYWYNTVPKNVFKIDFKPCCTIFREIMLKGTDYINQPEFNERLIILDDEILCTVAATYGHYDCLKAAHALSSSTHITSNVFDWNRSTIVAAAYNGHVDCLEFLHKNGCEGWGRSITLLAATQGHLNCLQYAWRSGCPWHQGTCAKAAANGHLECLKFAHEHQCPWDLLCTYLASKHGHLRCLEYAHSHGCPINKTTCAIAAIFGQVQCVSYLQIYGNRFPMSKRRINLFHGEGSSSTS